MQTRAPSRGLWRREAAPQAAASAEARQRKSGARAHWAVLRSKISRRLNGVFWEKICLQTSLCSSI